MAAGAQLPRECLAPIVAQGAVIPAIVVAATFEVGKAALGDAFPAIEIATVLAHAGIKLVPDIAVGGSARATRLADVLVARMLVAPKATA